MTNVPKSPLSSKGLPKLLIVDDETDNLDILYRTFHREYKVIRAKSGFEALAILAKESDVSVIITDQRMPMMSGTELLSQVAEAYPDTLRIVLTAYTDVRDLVQAINESKVFKYITKPYEIGVLRTVVRQAMEAHQLLKERTSKLRDKLESAEAKYKSIFENAIEGIFQTTLDGHYVIANRMLAQIYGYKSVRELIENITNIAEQIYVNPYRRQEFIDILGSQDTISNFESQVYRRDRSKIWISENVRAIRDWQGKLIGFEGTVQDITQRKRAEEESQLLQCLTLEISAAQHFQTALEIALTKICQFTGWDYGEAWTPVVDAEQLVCSSAWYSSIEGLEIFREHSEKISFPAGIGFPGRVWVHQKPEWIWDISLEAESNFLRKHLAMECGLKSGLAIPVSDDHKVVAIVVFFTRTPNDHDQHLVGPIGAIAMQLGALMRRKRDEEMLRQMNEELATARDRALEANRTKSTFVANMSHELRTPLNAIIGYSEMLQEDAALLGLEDFEQDLQKIHQSGKHLLDLINDILDMTKIEAGKLEIYPDYFDLPKLVWDSVNTIQPLLLKNNNRLNIDCDETLGSIYADMTRVRQVLLNVLSNACKFTKTGLISVQVSRQTISPQRSPNLSSRECFQILITDTGIGISPENIQKLFQPFNQVDSSTTRQYGGTGLGLAISHRLCQMMGGSITVSSELGKGSQFMISLPVDHRESAKLSAQPPNPNDAKHKHQISEQAAEQISEQISEQEFEQEHINEHNFNEHNEQLLEPAPHQAIAHAVPSAAVIAANPQQPQQLAENATTSYPSVLVIDDDPLIHQFTRSHLGKRGLFIYSAFNGEEGISLAQQITPSAIILDVQMPQMSGWEVLKELKSQPLTSGIPIILLTISEIAVDEPINPFDNSDNCHLGGYEIGANDYLFKPIDRDRLIATIDKYRSQHQQQFSILIVEDDSNIRAMLRRMLEKENCLVFDVQDGHEALASIPRYQPQLILLDLVMPNVNGFEFIHLLRLCHDIGSIPIVVITAKDLDETDRIRLSGSVQKILQKTNYSYPQLLSAIELRLHQLGIIAANV